MWFWTSDLQCPVPPVCRPPHHRLPSSPLDSLSHFLSQDTCVTLIFFSSILSPLVPFFHSVSLFLISFHLSLSLPQFASSIISQRSLIFPPHLCLPPCCHCETAAVGEVFPTSSSSHFSLHPPSPPSTHTHTHLTLRSSPLSLTVHGTNAFVQYLQQTD